MVNVHCSTVKKVYATVYVHYATVKKFYATVYVHYAPVKKLYSLLFCKDVADKTPLLPPVTLFVFVPNILPQLLQTPTFIAKRQHSRTGIK